MPSQDATGADIINRMKVVGRYELLNPTGHGGMAVVYLARQVDLDRRVALKELRMFQAPDDPALAERFLREARMAGSMSHPNIVTVHEYFKHDGTPYIAMEYLQRGSLRAWVGGMSVAQIVGVLEGLLAALDHAERNHIVHRDLKPENLLVTDQGQVKVADFGIAKARTMNTNAFLTAAGTTVGTPTYMAPEQAMALELGPYTDLYSVGVMAYEMLVGRAPFHDTDTPVAIILRHVNEPIPSAHTVNPAVDPQLSEWIDRLLIKDPTQRTQTAEEAWDELEEVALRLLGSRWRRDARLLATAEQPAARPLTPAPFTSTDVGTPVPQAPADEFESFAWGAAAAAPADAPSASSVDLAAAPPPPGPDVLEPEPQVAEPAPPERQPPAPAPQPAPQPDFVTFRPEPMVDRHAAAAAAAPSAPPVTSPSPPAPAAASPAAPTPSPPLPRTAEPEPAAAVAAPPPAVDRVARAGEDARTVMPDAVPERPQPPPRPPSSPEIRRRRRLALLGAAAAALVVVAVVVVLSGGGGGGDDAGDVAPTASPGAALANADLALTPPATWVKRAAPEIPGLDVPRPLVAGPRPNNGAYIASALVPGVADPSLLPPKLLEAVSGRTPKPETVTLAGLQAYRYDALRLRGSPGPQRVFAVLTTKGVATIVCGGTATTPAAADCDAVAETLQLKSARGLPLGPSPDFEAILGRTFASLNGRIAKVKVAASARGQAAQARGLAGSYTAAAGALGPAAEPDAARRPVDSFDGLTPVDVGLASRLGASFVDVAAIYERFAKAVQGADAGEKRRALDALSRSRATLASTTTAMAGFGYTARLRTAPTPRFERPTPPPAASPPPAAATPPPPAAVTPPASPQPPAQPSPPPGGGGDDG